MEIDAFDCNHVDNDYYYDIRLFRRQLINTLFELCDNYSSLTGPKFKVVNHSTEIKK